MIGFSVRFFPYELPAPVAVGAMKSAGPRPGTLIQFLFVDGLTGWADCFPWPELGDQPLDFQIQELKEGRMTVLTRQSYWHARREATSYQGKEGAVDIVVNHFLITDLLNFQLCDFLAQIKSGYTTFKIKVSVKPNEVAIKFVQLLDAFEEYSQAHPKSKTELYFRFDFNSRSNPIDFDQFVHLIGDKYINRVQFIEDPFPFDFSTWEAANKRVPLALDLEEPHVDWAQIEKMPFQFLILKPARQDVDKYIKICNEKGLRCVVTSSLDHPLGRKHAMWVARDVGGVAGTDYPRFNLGGSCRVMLNPKLDKNELARLEKLAELHPQKDGIWIASSGSSSQKDSSLKLVALSRAALEISARSVNAHLEVHPGDIWAQVLPKFHVGGLGIEIRADLIGNQVVDALCDGKWSPQYFVEICRRQKVTLVSLVPTQVFDLVQLGLTAPMNLRAVLVGATALSEKLYFEARRLGWPLLPSYGMTELASTVAVASLESLEGSVCFPEMRLLDHIQATVDVNGFLVIQSPSVMSGFAQWVNGEALWTPCEFLQDSNQLVRRCFQTQDLATLNGRVLKVVGRSTDFVKVLGEGVNLARLLDL